ncbi:MAG: NAD(P)H-dependent oxidoreductase [Brevinematales bacterium]|nr:NAD(P)H-dependent oxidoreductase [Brevinematales bacterium]
MRVLVLFYSYEGNTEFIAKIIAEEVHAEVESIKPVEEKHYHGVMKYVWNGKAALMREKPTLIPLKKDILAYDLIFLGTPVWAGTWVPVFNTLFQQNDFMGKKVACFYCHAGGPGSIEKRFRKQLVSASLLGFCGFIDPLWSKYKEKYEKQAREWAREMLALAMKDKR